MMTGRHREAFYSMLLLLAALIWGVAFVAQSIGAEHVGPFTFLSLRSWLGAAALLPLILIRGHAREKETAVSKEAHREKRGVLLAGSLITGFFLFAASAAQQIGIAQTTAGKSGFITAMYVVLVPVLSVLAGKRPPRRIWLCVVLSVCGLYLLCVRDGFRIGRGDLWTLACAFLFAFQIMFIARYAHRVDAVQLTCLEFVFEAFFATVCMLLWERSTTAEAVRAALPAILYAGIFSSGVGYTLQTLGEREVSPPVASLAMCMESVFSALAGWLILREALSLRELSGCALMILSIVVAQLGDINLQPLFLRFQTIFCGGGEKK